MSTDPGNDPLQTFLANAFAVQKSGIDAHSLSAFVAMQKSIATGQCDVDGVMRLVADRARDVANATGIAVALLDAGQLVYRAGSGSAAARIGLQMKAVVSVSAHNVRSEILRVENAQTDSRIQAEICRQFGSDSLLVLPIYREHAVAGVLEVHFSQAHTFEDAEVRAYRLMAGLVEEALLRAAHVDQKKAVAVQPSTVSQAMQQIASQTQTCRNDRPAPGPAPGSVPKSVPRSVPNSRTAQVGRAFPALSGKLPDQRLFQTATPAIAERVKRTHVTNLGWAVAAIAVVSAFVISGWIAYEHHAASLATGSAILRSNMVKQLPSIALQSSATSHLSHTPTNASETQETKRTLPGFRRIALGQHEVDYVAEDVTVRLFTPNPAPQRVQNWNREVNIGDDVTVRYFANKPAAGQQATPIPSAAQSAERSSEKSK